MIGVSAKRERRCPEALALRETACREWCRAETHEQVRSCWGRLGGLVTLHRYGTEHFVVLALLRWGRISREDYERTRPVR